MKAFTATALFILSFAFTSSAQVFKPGIILGLNAAQVAGDGYGGFHKLGLIAGGLVNTSIAEDWSVQFELYYIKKGSRKIAHPDKGDYESFNLNLNYIEMPLVIRYHHDNFNFETGLQVARLFSHSVYDSFGETSIVDPQIHDWDFGGLIGFSYQYKERAEFNVRLKSSIIPIRDFENGDAYTWWWDRLFSRGWYNTELNFSVRWLIAKN